MTPPAAPAAPAAPTAPAALHPAALRRRLRPGVPVVARDHGVLQVGLDPPHRVLLPDLRAVRALVDALVHGAEVSAAGLDPDDATARSLARLEQAGLLVSSDDVRAVEPALLARHGTAARARQQARTSARLHLDVAPRLLPDVRRLIDDAGLVVTADADRADAVLVVADGWLERARVDGWVREGVPHLCVEACGGGFVVGPLVVAGATACLRCVDSHRGEHDPARALVLDRAAARSDPAPHDRLGAALALGWAVRDLRRLVEGERPDTWSATVSVDVGETAGDDAHGGAVGPLAPRTWTRHPCCGCGWDVRVG